jgi:chemotaxis protein MotB
MVGSMARKNKKHAEHENHERWLITYADLITLLLIFFVILYSMSKIDKAKYTVIAQSLAFQFKKADTVVPKGTTGIADPGTGVDGNQAKKNPDKISRTEKEQAIAEQEAEQEKKEQELQDLLKKIQNYVTDQNLQSQVSAADKERGISITLNDLFLFDSGKADLKPAAFPVLEKLASLFPTLNTKISIEGHTDNQPLNTGSLYRDNWGLSSARSLSVTRYFIDVSRLNPKTIIGTYYADTAPVAENDTAEHRQQNRRVEIIVLRDK